MTFNIYDEETWDLASDSIFMLNGKTFLHDENETFTEKGLVKSIDGVIHGISNDEKGRKDVERVGRQKFIAHLLDNMDKRIAFYDSLEETIHWMCHETFDIFNGETWRFADYVPLLWNGKQVMTNTGEPFTEVLFVAFIIELRNHMVETYSEEKLSAIGLENIACFFLDENVSGTSFDQIIQVINVMIIYGIVNKDTAKEFWKNLTQKKQAAQNYDTKATISAEPQNITDSTSDLTPPSYFGLVIGIISIIIGIIMILIFPYNNYNSSLWIFGLIFCFLSIIPFAMYSSAKSKFSYKAICAEMAQWVGRSSNDLIIQWGAPSKTYKFPTDKTMTVLEYKDSIRNYLGYRHKGMYAGQSKTTKYIKSFFVKDNVIVNYKYSIT